MALGRFKSLLDSLPGEMRAHRQFPDVCSSAPSTPEGALEYYDGKIRIVDGEGNIVADGLDPRRYSTFLGEASEEWSFMKFPYYKPLGYPGGKYRVGPLARLNIVDASRNTARGP